MGMQQAHRDFLNNRDFTAYAAAFDKLDRFRKTTENDFVSNLAFLRWDEDYTWGRRAAKLMTGPHEKLPDQWQFAFDPEAAGEAQQWFAPGFDSSQWTRVSDQTTWDKQEPGKKWKAEHGGEYLGTAWYRSSFTAPGDAKEAWLVFGAVATACKVWVNGELVLDRPSPIWGSPDEWMQPFEADISKALKAGQTNTVAVRVRCDGGSGGLWQPVWVAYPR
jgi:beta-galactosidase/beta-glucuronidase